MAKIRICKDPHCKNAATTSGYCRLHYLKHWKRLKQKEQERAAKRLNRYIEHMVKRHPDRYIDAIKKDLRSSRFDKFVEDRFGFDEDAVESLFSEPTFDEDVRKLIDKLRNSED